MLYCTQNLKVVFVNSAMKQLLHPVTWASCHFLPLIPPARDYGLVDLSSQEHSEHLLVVFLCRCYINVVMMTYQYICTYMHTCRYYMAHRNQNVSMISSAAIEIIFSLCLYECCWEAFLNFWYRYINVQLLGCVARDLFWKVECFCFTQIRWWFARSVCPLFVVSHRSASGWFGWAIETGTGQNH